MDEKLKSEIMQKEQFLCLCYILRAIRTGRWRERRYADHIFIQILQNAPLRRQISKIVFASGGKGALTPNQNPADVPACKWLAPFAADVQINIKYFIGYGVL